MRTEDHDIQRIARRRVARKTGFYIHLLVYLLVNTGLYGVNLWTASIDGHGIRWHQFPLLGWGLGLAIHGLVTWLSLTDLRETMVDREVERLRRR